nr:hypothetical protein [Clostridia bacterium]
MSARKKTEKSAEKKYTVTLNERQLRLICTAVEEYGRLRMGQTMDLSDDLAFQNYEYKKDDPEFDRRLLRREATRELLDLAMRAASNGDYMHFQKTEDVMVALDMYSVIRNFFWHQLPEDKREDWTVDADPVYIWGPEPKITVKKEGE